MYLKKIRLLGFKSFCDPQVLELNTAISAIVGPNGCGKSNIIDAVKCLTGQSKAKEMRGEQISDLIFNGSDQRRPVGQAQVELIFDNKSQLLKGPFAHYSEVAVKRVIGRDGQSSFYINQTRCRRKDVIDLFTGTGLGPKNYAIIEQGMIARFIEAKPAEVRAYIEEVAGISRYKERRKETLSQLDSSRDNLIRLEDIQRELSDHVVSLAEQAQEAQRYQKLKHDLLIYKQQHTSYLYQQAQQHSEAAQQKMIDSQKDHEQSIAYLRSLSQHSAQHEQQYEQAQQQLLDLKNAQHQLQLLIEQKKSQWQQAKQRRHFLQQDCQQWEEQLAQLNKQIEELHKKLEQSTAPWSDLETNVAQLAEQLAHSRQHKHQKSQDYQAAQKQYQQDKDQFQQMAQQHAQQQLKLEYQSSEIKRLQAGLSMALEHQKNLQAELQSLDIESLQKEYTEKQLGVQQLLSSYEQHQSQELGLKSAIEELKWQLQHTIQQLAQTQKERHKIQSVLQARKTQKLPWLGFSQAKEMGLSDYPCDQRSYMTALSAAFLYHGQQPPTLLSLESVAERDCEYVFGQDKAPSYWQHIKICSSAEEALKHYKSLASYEALLIPGGCLIGPNWVRPQRQRSEVLLSDLEQQASALQETELKLQQQQAQLQKELQQKQTAIQQMSAQLAYFKKEYTEAQKNTQQAEHLLIRSQQRLSDLQHRIEEKTKVAEHHHLQLQQAQQTVTEFQLSVAELAETQQQHRALLEEKQQAEENLYQQYLQIDARYEQLLEQHQKQSSEIQRLKSQREQEQKQQQDYERKHQEIVQLLASKQEQLQQSLTPIEHLEEDMASDMTLYEIGQRRVAEQQEQIDLLQKELDQHHRSQRQAAAERDKRQAAFVQAQMEFEKSDIHQKHLEEQILDQGWTLSQIATFVCDLPWDILKKEMAQTQKEFDALGPVNLRAIAEYEQQSQRLNELQQQCADLRQATEMIEKALAELDVEMKNLFKDTFEQLQKNFEELFPILFGGGRAKLFLEEHSMTDEEPGVIIQAQPPGKKNASLSLLSGGEKALTAAALLFAFFQLNPAPFCLLDEIDAPLDDANTARLGQMIAKLSEKTQFIIVTHSKVMMEFASSLYGVTMKEPGVSRLVSVSLDEALQVVGEES